MIGERIGPARVGEDAQPDSQPHEYQPPRGERHERDTAGEEDKEADV